MARRSAICSAVSGGLEVGDIDFLRELRVRRQPVSLLSDRPYLGPLKKSESTRTVPFAKVTVDAIAAHLAAHPPSPLAWLTAPTCGGR